MLKYHQTLSSQIYDEFSKPNMRGTVSLSFLLYFIQSIPIRNILEIGFYEGQTFGLMLEATQPGSVLTAIDIDFRLDVFQKFFQNSNFVKDKTIELVEKDSLSFTPTRKYDLINVDGDNPNRKSNIKLAINNLSDNRVLMVDNYHSDYNKKVIGEFISSQKTWQPFLLDSQAVYFKREQTDFSNFVDNTLTPFNEIASLYNIDYHGYTVKEIKPMPVLIHHCSDMMHRFCYHKNI